MYIYLTLLLPIITGVVLYIYFKRFTVWWELLLPFGVTILTILIVKNVGESIQTSSTEYLNDIIVEARDYQYWDEEVSCRHSYDCNCTTDSKGNETCSTCYRHSYDVDEHPEHYTIITKSGKELSISQDEYNRLLNLFGNKTFVDMHRDYHSVDGDMYKAVWPDDQGKLQCVVSEHTYKNKVKVSNSIFNFPTVSDKDKKAYALFDYPQITYNYKQQHVLGTFAPAAERNMEILNGLYGATYQLKSFVLVFKNKTQMAGKLQQWYWKGGNKNEFILCIGVDKDNNIKWVYPFTWSEHKESSIVLRNYVLSKKQLDLTDITSEMIKDLKGFQRKHFKDFDYLEIEPTTGQMVWTIILSILFNIGTAIFIVMNEIEEDDDNNYSGYKTKKRKISNFQSMLEKQLSKKRFK